MRISPSLTSKITPSCVCVSLGRAYHSSTSNPCRFISTLTPYRPRASDRRVFQAVCIRLAPRACRSDSTKGASHVDAANSNQKMKLKLHCLDFSRFRPLGTIFDVSASDILVRIDSEPGNCHGVPDCLISGLRMRHIRAEGLTTIPNLASNSHLWSNSWGIASPIESSQSIITIDVSKIAIMSRICSDLGTNLPSWRGLGAFLVQEEPETS